MDERPTLILVNWYGERESIFLGAEAFRDRGWKVVSYPHLEKRLTAIEFGNFVLSNDAKMVLFWCFMDIDQTYVREGRMKSPTTLFCLFNWDDPHKTKFTELHPFYASLDHVFTSCVASQTLYSRLGVPSTFLPPGTAIMPFKADITYDCDVSFVITNLYDDGEEFPHQVISRRDIISRLANMPTIRFRLYGPDFLQPLAPTAYAGFLPYSQLARVFQTSRLNICPHGAIGYKYMNERDSGILGAGGLLLTDSELCARALPKGTHVILDTVKMESQIYSLLEDDNALQAIRQNGHNFAENQLGYDRWAEKIATTVGGISPKSWKKI